MMWGWRARRERGAIEDRLRAVCGHLNVLHAELVALAAEALATGAWAGDGLRSLAHWLNWQVEAVRLISLSGCVFSRQSRKTGRAQMAI